MIMVVTSTLDKVPEGSVQQEYIDTLVVACKSWQAQGTLAKLKDLGGDRIIRISLDKDQHESQGFQWIYVVHKCYIWVMIFSNASELEEFTSRTGYDLKPYPGREDCGVNYAFYA